MFDVFYQESHHRYNTITEKCNSRVLLHNIFIGTLIARIVVAVAIVGGNCNNGAKVGSRYVNLNNTVSNAWWNNGASPSLALKRHSSVFIIAREKCL